MSLPAAPPTLKAVSAYVQRSNELSTQDPVIAYWCAYHAAQTGISMKLKDAESRKFLLSLLGALESMKQAIGPNDAIDDEAVSAAYIENFAMKVFASADAEDRRGEATRATAKKFLASANFLELLRIFDREKDSTNAESPNEEKIRYAKWKAADIAKAFRLGQKPTPGPATSADDSITSIPTPDVTATTADAPAFTRATSPPPALDLVAPSPENRDFRLTPGAGRSGFLPPNVGVSDGGLAAPDNMSPGGWSTIATPGTPGTRNENAEETEKRAERRRRAWVSGELEGKEEEEEIVEAEGFVGVDSNPTNSLEGMQGQVSPPLPPLATPSSAPPDSDFIHISPPITLPSLPSVPSPPESSADVNAPLGSIPTSIHLHPSAPPLPSPPAGFVPPSIQTPTHLPPVSPPLPPAPHITPTSLPPSGIQPAPVPPRFVPAAAPAPVPVPLTPQMIARVQKHARFAISALDYEDVEQARKELRAALQMLGG